MSLTEESVLTNVHWKYHSLCKCHLTYFLTEKKKRDEELSLMKITTRTKLCSLLFQMNICL